jgi:hypothetical protein
MALSLGEDVASLLTERTSVLRALADLHACLSAAAAEVKMERDQLNDSLQSASTHSPECARVQQRGNTTQRDNAEQRHRRKTSSSSSCKRSRRPKKMLAAHLRKVFFFQVWAVEQSQRLFATLSVAVDTHVSALREAAAQPADRSVRRSVSPTTTTGSSTSTSPSTAKSLPPLSVSERLLNIHGGRQAKGEAKRHVLIQEVE